MHLGVLIKLCAGTIFQLTLVGFLTGSESGLTSGVLICNFLFITQIDSQ